MEVPKEKEETKEEADEEEADEEGVKKPKEAVPVDEDPEPDYAAGEYGVITELLKVLENGPKIKAEVDASIDKCGKLENIRTQILALKDKHEKEVTESGDMATESLQQAKHALERYFNLLCFHAYLHDNQADEFSKTFSEWKAENSKYWDILGSHNEGALSNFDWT